MIHPLFCYLGIAFSFALSFTLFISGTLDERKFFYLPIVLLIAFYTVHAVATDKQTYQKRSFKQSVLTATGKYLLWGFILLAIIALYHFHPGYRAMTTNTRRFFEHFFYAFAVCGWPYFFLADKYRYCLTNVMVDHYITIAVLLRCLKRRQFHLFKRRLATRQTKRMLISAALRVHFIPVMFEQVYLGVTAFTLQAHAQTEQVISASRRLRCRLTFSPIPLCSCLRHWHGSSIPTMPVLAISGNLRLQKPVFVKWIRTRVIGL